ncbi:MAG: CT583 family protein [Parachlamydiales bacterium]|nr:CT583 family protein [Parachlamydiales bacterium]
MSKLNELLGLRLKKKTEEEKNKILTLAQLSSKGHLSSFSGVFPITPLNEREKEDLLNIVKEFSVDESYDYQEDLSQLMNITSEVKAITNQAIILHGERIKKAQNILKNYQEGAFTAWLVATYGNRQTPYNFLQYYNFIHSMPQDLHTIIDTMPRQAIYTLASRPGQMDKKQEIVQNYRGESKKELLTQIRQEFPLDRDDKRLPNLANQAIASLKRNKDLFSHSLFSPNEKQKILLHQLLDELHTLLNRR